MGDKKERRVVGKIISLKVSNIDLASAILLTKRSVSFSTALNAIISTVLEDFRNEKVIPYLSNEEALGIIEKFSEEKGFNIPGRDVISKKTRRKEDFYPPFPSRTENFSLTPESAAIKGCIELNPTSEASTLCIEPEPEVELPIFPKEIALTPDAENNEIKRLFEREIMTSVEEIQAEEENDLLKKILLKTME